MVNGVDVQEHMNGGTSVIPNLDSIQEFRVLTDNFDTEYGNYNGGMINVVTKSGSNSFHGECLRVPRNTDLDARNFFDATRGAFQQNQFGGTIGSLRLERTTTQQTPAMSLIFSYSLLSGIEEALLRCRMRPELPMRAWKNKAFPRISCSV